MVTSLPVFTVYGSKAHSFNSVNTYELSRLFDVESKMLDYKFPIMLPDAGPKAVLLLSKLILEVKSVESAFE